MSSVFDPAVLVINREVNTDYLRFLKERDGAADRRAGTLARREAYFAAIDAHPVPYEGPPLEADFRAALGAGASSSSPALALWMAIAASANEGEKYSVERILASRPPQADPEDPMTYIELEELYHTRLLLDAIKTLGVDYAVKAPPLWVRFLASTMIFAPKSIEYMVVFFSEVVGTVLFAALARKARELVDPATATGGRIVSLIEEILVDEVGHVAFARAQLGPVRLWIAKQTVRALAGAMYRATPAIRALFDTEALAEAAINLDLSTLPAHIRARAFMVEAPVATGLAPA